MGVTNLSLFTGQEGFEHLEKIVQEHEGRKRGTYNKKFATNDYIQLALIFVSLVDPNTYLNEIYSLIAHKYFSRPSMSNDETVFSFKGIRIYYMVYEAGEYDYFGNIYQGESFQVFQAEIIGTENLLINDRISLHTKLLEYLDEGVELKKAVELVQPDITRIKADYEKRKAYTMAENQSRIFTRV